MTHHDLKIEAARLYEIERRFLIRAADIPPLGDHYRRLAAAARAEGDLVQAMADKTPAG